MENLFINIDQTSDIEEYKYLQNKLIEQHITFLDCLEGIFIEDYNSSSYTKRLAANYKNQSELTNNKPLTISDNFYTTYDLSPNYYAIVKKKALDIEDTFKNFLYQIKSTFKFGFYIDWKTVKITYNSERNQVIVNFFYTLNTANRYNVKGIQQYLKNRYSKLLRKYSLIKNEY